MPVFYSYADAADCVARNTHAHSSSGALSITREAADQATVVTVTADATSFTDNLSDQDFHHYTLVNGTAADYTVDLSNITAWGSDPATSLPSALTLYQDTVVTLFLRKIEGVLYGTLNVPVTGAPQAGPMSVRGAFMSDNVSTLTVAASSLSTAPQTGDGLLFAVIAPGPSTAATVNYTAPAGATQFGDYGGSGFSPRIRLYSKTYAGEADWTFGSDSGISRVAVVAIANGTSFNEGAFRDTLNPPAATHSADGIGLYLGTSNFDNGDDSTWIAPPAGHTLVVDNRASVATDGNMQAQIASLALTGSGNYNPGPATFGAVQEHSSVAIVVSA